MTKVKPLHHGNSTPKPKKKDLVETEHTITQPHGSAYRVAVDHEDFKAIQYEFYIPRLVWNLPSVRVFIKRLDSIEKGATLFSKLGGVWEGEHEETNIYRKIIDRRNFQPSNTRTALHSAVGRLMADLSASPEFAQQAVMFTETPIRVTMSKNVRRI
jgi:hypothetical protein